MRTNPPRSLARSNRIWFIVSAGMVLVGTALIVLVMILAGCDHMQMMRK